MNKAMLASMEDYDVPVEVRFVGKSYEGSAWTLEVMRRSHSRGGYAGYATWHGGQTLCFYFDEFGEIQWEPVDESARHLGPSATVHRTLCGMLRKWRRLMP